MIMEKTKLTSRKFYWYGTGILFLCLYSISTSPLTSNFWGSDSAFFQMVGKNLNRGMVLYKDIFDIKGPYIFFIQFLGYAIGGRYGVFFIQIINICIILYLIKKIVYLVSKRNTEKCLKFTMIIFFFYLACTLDCGNLTEEYALPYIFLSIYFYIRYIQKQRLGYAAFGYGFSFGIVIMGRVTNAAFIGVIVLSITIDLIVKKQWKKFVQCIVLFIIGLTFAVAPCIIYFVKMKLLFDVFNAMLGFSYLYATESDAVSSIMSIRWPIMVMFLAVEGFAIKANLKNKQRVCFLILSIVVMVFVLMLGNAYIHYYQLLIPSIMSAFWLLWDGLEQNGTYTKKVVKRQTVILTFIMILGSVYFIPYSGRVFAAIGVNTKAIEQTAMGKFAKKVEQLDSFGRGTYGYKCEESVADIFNRISQDSRDSVYNYQTNSQWLLLSGLKPYQRYCITADHFSCLSKEISDEIEDMFEKNPPQYIVMDRNAFISNIRVAQHLSQEYSLIYQNSLYELYQKVDN